MPVSQNEIRDVVLKCLCLVIKVSGLETPSDMNDRMDPIDNLGLDSHDGIMFALEVENRLNMKIPDSVNPFRKEGKGNRCIGEIVVLIWDLIAKKPHIFGLGTKAK